MAFIVIFSLPFFPFHDRWILQWVRLWARVSVFLCQHVAGITYRIEGREHLTQGRIIACRHESLWETMIFFHCLERPYYVLKKQLADIPVYGWLLKRLGSPVVDRDQGIKAIRALKACVKNTLREPHGHIVIFPEGTRRAPAEAPTIKPGIFILYQTAHVGVIPTMLNSGTFWPRRGFIKKPGEIVLSFKDPIPPGMNRKMFMDILLDRLQTAHHQFRRLSAS